MMEKFIQTGVQATTIFNVDLTETPASPRRNRVSAALASMQGSLHSRRTDQSENQSLLSSEGELTCSSSPKSTDKSGAWKRVKALRAKLPSIQGSLGTRSRSSEHSQSSRKSNHTKFSQSQTQKTSAEEVSPVSNNHAKLINRVPELSSDHFCAAGSRDGGLPLCPHHDHDHDRDPSERSEIDDTPPIATLTFDNNDTPPATVEETLDEQ